MASGTIYLGLEDVLGLYAEITDCSEQEARNQLRSPSGLAGALSRPATYAHYQGADVAVQAAVLAHGIAEGQHFVEGNKRVALVAMRTFLLVNGYELSATQEERAAWIVRLSEGGTTEELAEKLRGALVPAG